MRRMALLLLLACFGCGDRSLHPGPADGGSRDGAVDGHHAGDGGGACVNDTDCVVAVRTDNCCQAAYPELASVVAADPCLELWSAVASTPTPQQCYDKWDPQCAYVDCMPAPPSSRVAQCANGKCEFAPECIDGSDCTVAIDTRSCCPCPEPVPALLLAEDRCLVQYPQTVPTPSGCGPQACPAMPCPNCPAVGAVCLSQTCESGVR